MSVYVSFLILTDRTGMNCFLSSHLAFCFLSHVQDFNCVLVLTPPGQMIYCHYLLVNSGYESLTLFPAPLCFLRIRISQFKENNWRENKEKNQTKL